MNALKKNKCTRMKCFIKEKIVSCSQKKEEKKQEKTDKAECSEVFRDLGECLQKAIISASSVQQNGNKNGAKKNDCLSNNSDKGDFCNFGGQKGDDNKKKKNDISSDKQDDFDCDYGEEKDDSDSGEEKEDDSSDSGDEKDDCVCRNNKYNNSSNGKKKRNGWGSESDDDS